jgi:chromosome segregation ATPase
MLQNLVTQIETEAASDEQDMESFNAWFARQSDATESSISMLSSRLQELGAVISDLASRKNSLTTEVTRLTGEIDQTQSQINEATEKRKQENQAFVQEQLDFDNSIAACGKAVEMLIKFYGDGTPKESTRPAWMSLVSTLQKLHVVAAARKHASAPKLESFLQTLGHTAQTPGMRGSTMHTAYETKTGEALSIVEQVKGLQATFQEDKESSIDQEQELTAAFTSLMQQKTAQLNSLVQQRDTQQAILNQVSQELEENRNAEATAKATLLDEQAYLSAIQKEHTDTNAMFQQRQHDRAEEKTAVNMALRVLSQENPTLLQLHHKTQAKVVRKARAVAHVKVSGCPLCHRASLMLRQKAQGLHSELLATAAMTTGSGEALQPVVAQLQDLVRRIDDQQRAEEEHKDWCEHELAETAKTKAHHEQLVEELKQKIEDTQGEIADKQQGIKDTAEAIQTADKEFNELKDERAKAKAEFEAEHADYVDAIQALNQAIDILGDFYRDQQEFVQVGAATNQMPPADLAGADRAGSPTTMGNYVRKGGGHVVKILKDTRVDFEAGKKSLEEQEEQQIADFQAASDAYDKSRADLVDAGNRLAAELQSAQLALSQHQGDLESNEQKVQAATSYLAQVGGSCNMLIQNFAERTRLRQEESKAIQDAIGILQQAAYA